MMEWIAHAGAGYVLAAYVVGAVVILGMALAAQRALSRAEKLWAEKRP